MLGYANSTLVPANPISSFLLDLVAGALQDQVALFNQVECELQVQV